VTSIPIGRFEEMYDRAPDPWGFSSRWYEARKYALTAAALPHRRYRRAFEPGCSIGVLTEALAERCDYLLAADGVASAVEQARRRLADRPHVEVRKLVLPQEWPDGPWDLIVLSEIAYYFAPSELSTLLDRAAATSTTGGTLIAVHWRGQTDYPQSGDAVHQAIGAHRSFEHAGGYCETLFGLDVYQRRDH
jgi:trans-aconitate methyltransferase